jgi:hypothetical protein
MKAMFKMKSTLTGIQSLRSEDDGGLTIFGLYIFACIAMISGIAIDMSNLVAQHTKLQMTADLAAHAALYNRDSNNASDSIAAALAVVENSMPAAQYGTVIDANDFIFGDFDYASGDFTPNADSRNGVLVTATRYASSLNAVDTFLLGFSGVPEIDVAAQALFVTFRPACLREGFVAEDVVDLQSNNGFANGFCIHSNTHVSLNSNNNFEEGTVVSMPDLDQLDLPKSGFESNIGLEVALRRGRMHIRVLGMIDEIAAGLLDSSSEHIPDYIIDTNVHRHSGKRFDASDFVPGTINHLNCSSGVSLRNDAGAYSEVVIYSECKISLSQGVIFEDVVMFSESTRRDSIKGASGIQLGRDDSCDVGGGVQVISRGGMSFPADLSMDGGQLIALGEIEFAANADGVEGASMISAKWISGTSNMDMAFCGSGMENNFEAEYFRLAR